MPETDEQKDDKARTEEAAVSAFGSSDVDSSGFGHQASVNPNYGQPDSQGFVGVDGVRANYANDTDKPYNVDEDKVSDKSNSSSKSSTPAAKAPASKSNE